MKATFYTKPNCPYCVKAKFLLTQKGIQFEELSAIDRRAELFERVNEATGDDPKSVPQIWLDDLYIGGYDQLVEHFAQFDAGSAA